MLRKLVSIALCNLLIYYPKMSSFFNLNSIIKQVYFKLSIIIKILYTILLFIVEIDIHFIIN